MWALWTSSLAEKKILFPLVLRTSRPLLELLITRARNVIVCVLWWLLFAWPLACVDAKPPVGTASASASVAKIASPASVCRFMPSPSVEPTRIAPDEAMSGASARPVDRSIETSPFPQTY